MLSTHDSMMHLIFSTGVNWRLFAAFGAHELTEGLPKTANHNDHVSRASITRGSSETEGNRLSQTFMSSVS